MSTRKFFQNTAKLNILERIKTSNKIPLLELPERFKGTIVEKWANYWRALLRDYKEVVLDTSKSIKEKPLRAGIYGLVGGSIYYASKNNPDLTTLEDTLRTHNNSMVLIHESCHRKESAEYLIFIERCLNEGLLRRLSIGIASFLWIDNYNKSLALYKSTCSHLKPQYSKFNDRIIDIGFWNKWHKLEKVMIDYDVNIN